MVLEKPRKCPNTLTWAGPLLLYFFLKKRELRGCCFFLDLATGQKYIVRVIHRTWNFCN